MRRNRERGWIGGQGPTYKGLVDSFVIIESNGESPKGLKQRGDRSRLFLEKGRYDCGVRNGSLEAKDDSM